MSEKYLGAVVSPADNRDYQAKDYISAGVRPAEYYPKVICPVHHQEAGDCTAWALATAKFYHELRERDSLLCHTLKLKQPLPRPKVHYQAL